MSKPAITKGIQTYEKKGRRKIAPMPQSRVPLPLDKAIEEQRLPTKEEILGEVIALCSTMLVGLRGSDNIHKSADSIKKIMNTVREAYAVQKIDDLEPEVLENMDDKELKEYLLKQLDMI